MACVPCRCRRDPQLAAAPFERSFCTHVAGQKPCSRVAVLQLRRRDMCCTLPHALQACIRMERGHVGGGAVAPAAAAGARGV